MGDGASGELRVAEILAACDEVHALHDRRVPGSKANIDHIAVSHSGVYVIDAKKYTGHGLGKFVTRPSDQTAFDPAVVPRTIRRNLQPA